MTSKKAASLSSALLARKGSAVPAGLSESESPAAGTPLPGLLKVDTEQKNGNGHFHPISLERPRKAAPAAKLGCDDPLQPPLIPGLTLQTGPTFKAEKTATVEAAPDAAAPEKPAAPPEKPAIAPEQPAPTPQPASAESSEKPEKTETPIKAAPPLKPKTPPPAPDAAAKEKDYPEAPKPRATPAPSTAGQTLVAERRVRPETAPSAARLAAAAAGKTGEPMPMPAIAAIATVVVLALAGAGYLFFSDKAATTDVAAAPPATENATTLAAVTPPATEPAETAATADALPPIPGQTALTVASLGGDPSAVLPTPRPDTAIEPVTHLAAAGPEVVTAAVEESGDTPVVALAAVETTEPAGAGSSVAAADEGPGPAPHRPTADTSNIVPTAAGSAPLPTPKPERLAALSNAAGGNGGGRFAVQLASVPSAAAAEREIRRLKRAYPTLFGSMAIDVQRSRSGYRLMSQRFEERGQAADLCQSLKDAGRGCLVLAR